MKKLIPIAGLALLLASCQGASSNFSRHEDNVQTNTDSVVNTEAPPEPTPIPQDSNALDLAGTPLKQAPADTSLNPNNTTDARTTSGSDKGSKR